MKRVRIEDDSESNYDYEDGAHGQCCSDSLSRPNDDDDNDNDNGDNDCNNIEKGWMTQRKSHKSRRTSRAKKSGFRLAHFYKYKIIEVSNSDINFLIILLFFSQTHRFTLMMIMVNLIKGSSQSPELYLEMMGLFILPFAN
jgi:hypothetical protein